jgi:hypothetical protein
MVAELDKVQAEICERPAQSRNQMIRIMTIVCMTITYTTIAIRLITRYCLNQQFWMDDWFIIAVAVKYNHSLLVAWWLICSPKVTDFVFTYFGIQCKHDPTRRLHASAYRR